MVPEAILEKLEPMCKVYVISFLYSKCSTFQAAWVCRQSYASISHNPTKCAYRCTTVNNLDNYDIDVAGRASYKLSNLTSLPSLL